MSNVIIGIIGVVLFIGLSVASASWIGPQVMASRIEAAAVGYLNQSGQIARAVETFTSEKGRLPVEAGRNPIEILVSERYMKHAPEGGASGWELHSSDLTLITPVEGTVDHANKVCVAAREKAKMPNPERILKCDGSDAPDGVLSVQDPCCLM